MVQDKASGQTTGQQAAKILDLVTALLDAGLIAVDGLGEVGVLAIRRDDYPDAPLYVELATKFGHRLCPLDEIELIDR